MATKREKKEIRNLLLGKVVIGDDARLTTPEAGVFRVPQGITDGAGNVRLLGIKSKRRCYDTELDPEAMMAAAEQCMWNLGRSVHLREQENTAACLIRNRLTRPVVLTFRYVEEKPVLTAWTGRGLTAWIALRSAIRGFERILAKDIRPSAEEPPEDPKEEKRRRKKREKQAAEPQRETEQPAGTSGEPDGYDTGEEYGTTDDGYYAEEGYDASDGYYAGEEYEAENGHDSEKQEDTQA